MGPTGIMGLKNIRSVSYSAVAFGGISLFIYGISLPLLSMKLNRIQRKLTLDHDEFRGMETEILGQFRRIRLSAIPKLRRQPRQAYALCQCNAQNDCPQGPRGRPGSPGAPGENGDPGRKGQRGKAAMTVSSTLERPSDCASCQGGRKGRPGPIGGPGLPGTTGQPGRPGQPGNRLGRGPPGAQGPPGQPGDNGGIGLPGDAGRNAIQNRPGGPGPRGGAGQPGSKGLLGPNGRPGLRGAQGPPGQRGPSGPKGPRGPSALPGRPDKQHFSTNGDLSKTDPSKPINNNLNHRGQTIVEMPVSNNQQQQQQQQNGGSLAASAMPRGKNLLLNPRLNQVISTSMMCEDRISKGNKDMRMSIENRKRAGTHGLLPPAVRSQEDDIERVMEALDAEPTDLARYNYLSSLSDIDENLFYAVMCKDVEKIMPFVYTPTVGEACKKFGRIYRKPKGLYVTINDNSVDQIVEILNNWPEKDVRAICVTDGERILGLGDLGTYGMGIPIGKLALYVALAGVKPQWCLPVVLDVGTNRQELLDDRWYTGLRQKRVTGADYDSLIDNFFKAVVKKYGQSTLIQFEDFGNANAFRLLEKYQKSYCTFNDDIQGTACVVVAGLKAAVKITSLPLEKCRILFYGAGEASIGIAHLTLMAMMSAGLSREEALKQIFMIDSKGLITKTRTNLTVEKQTFAQDYKDMKDLEEIVAELKPNTLLGATAQGGTFTEGIVKKMTENNERPIVFALSNPTSKAECTAEQAYTWSQGKCVFASGSPFKKVTLSDGQKFSPGQGNNSYIFPGVSLAVILFKIAPIKDDHFLVAAETLANMVTAEHLSEGRCYPPLSEMRRISLEIAVAVAEYTYKNKTGAGVPKPADVKAFIREHLYNPLESSSA